MRAHRGGVPGISFLGMTPSTAFPAIVSLNWPARSHSIAFLHSCRHEERLAHGLSTVLLIVALVIIEGSPNIRSSQYILDDKSPAACPWLAYKLMFRRAIPAPVP